MDRRLFIFYTITGSTIWTSTLAALGFFIGENREAVTNFLHQIVIILLVSCAVAIALYMFFKPARK